MLTAIKITISRYILSIINLIGYVTKFTKKAEKVYSSLVPNNS